MRLVRFKRDAHQTLGHLVMKDGSLFCCTLERPIGTNQKMEAIPAGTYTCRRFQSPHFQREVFEITGVPNRSRILIHWGNYVEDSQGCVLLGESFADINHDGFQDVAASKATFERFMAALKDVETFVLEVVNP